MAPYFAGVTIGLTRQVTGGNILRCYFPAITCGPVGFMTPAARLADADEAPQWAAANFS